jgi:pSer/pThr/pTyr-binding forkhead associated (FHA) protein
MGGVSANPSAQAQRAGRPCLLYRDGDGRDQVFSFDPGSPQLTVGRDPSSDLVLNWDGQVSRLHARLERAGDDWTVVDDGLSRNGTFLNGERLSGRRPLRDGDTVRFGTTTMTFRAPQAEQQAQPARPVASRPEVELSTSQRRVLEALCRPYKEGGFATPPTDEQVAEELALHLNAVRTHLAVLYAKLGVQDVPPDQKRVRLIETAFSTGLVAR